MRPALSSRFCHNELWRMCPFRPDSYQDSETWKYDVVPYNFPYIVNAVGREGFAPAQRCFPGVQLYRWLLTEIPVFVSQTAT